MNTFVDPNPRRLEFIDRQTYSVRMSKKIVSVSPDVMGGTPVFAGTRVPVQTLIDYLSGGETVDDFLDGFPTVSRKQVISFLEDAKNHAARKVA